MKELLVRREAEDDIAASYNWYEEKRKGLGERFMICVDEAMTRIVRNPKHYPMVCNPVRRALIKRFPFGVFYFEEEKSISVIAVMHSKRSPESWQSRT